MSVLLNRKSLLIIGSSALLAATAWAQSPTPQTQSTAVPGVSRLRHIIVLAQENRSFDQYFGELREYWAQNGYPDQSFDGLPQFNPRRVLRRSTGRRQPYPVAIPPFLLRAIAR